MSPKEAADRAGVSELTLRKHIQRGKLRARQEGRRIIIEEDDFDAYIAAQDLGSLKLEGKTVEEIGREYGMAIARLPQHVKDAILDGLPTSKKAGGSEQYRKAVRNAPRQAIVDIGEEQDPNRGFPVGHQHKDQPRWKRTGQNTWSDDQGSTWTWNGMFWEAGGKIEGRGPLPDGISPADPNSDRRPLIPSAQVKK